MQGVDTRMQSCRELIKNQRAIKNATSCQLLEMTEPLMAKTPAELASRIAQYIRMNGNYIHQPHLKGEWLATLAYEFHRNAGTLTPGVETTIQYLGGEYPRIIIAHQPNLFPSLRVIAPFILLDVVDRVLASQYSIPSTPIYLIVDYDYADDRRFKTAHIPDMFRRFGSLALSNGVPPRQRKQVMWVLEKPPRAILQRWIYEIKNWINNHIMHLYKAGILSAKKKKILYEYIFTNLHIIEADLLEAWNRSSSLVEFNSIFLSRIVNLRFSSNICFIPGHLMHRKNGQMFQWIANLTKKITEHASEAVAILRRNKYRTTSHFPPKATETLLWYICPYCNKRFVLKKSENLLQTSHFCSAFLKDISLCIPIESLHQCDRIYPKVLADNLLDIIALRKVGGTGYLGQAEHVLISNYIAHAFGLPVPPQIIFAIEGLYYGLNEVCWLALQDKHNVPEERSVRACSMSFQGRASILYYALSLGFNGIKALVEQHFFETDNIHSAREFAEQQDITLLSDLGFSLGLHALYQHIMGRR